MFKKLDDSENFVTKLCARFHIFYPQQPGADNEEDRRTEMPGGRRVCRVHNRHAAQRQDSRRSSVGAGTISGKAICSLYSLVCMLRKHGCKH